MVGGCIRLTVCSLLLCVGGSAGAQERGMTLYAAQCETCHKSPQDVTTFHGGVDLESFLGELHHADTPQSAASIADYLKRGKQAAQNRGNEPAKKRRRTKQRGGANPSTINAASSDDDPLTQTMKMLFGGANSSNENH